MSPLRVLIAPILLLTTAVATTAAAPAMDVPALIDRLTDVADSDLGYSSVASGGAFLPLDREGRWEVGVLFQKPAVPSETLRAIVKQGAAVVPQLIAHLDDKRPTKITVKHNFGLGGIFYGSQCDYNARTAKADPNPERSVDAIADDFGFGAAIDGHVLTVGDLCFVALGQIVNRRFDAVRYVPTAIIIVTSPTESPALRTAVKTEWDGLTLERHKASLIADFLKPDSDARRIGACKRLAYYYPDSLEPLALKFLAQPTYSVSDVSGFVRDRLYRADTAKERQTLFDAYIAKHGEAAHDGILLQLIDDMGHDYGDKPGRAFVELYGKEKDGKAGSLPWLDTCSTGAVAELISEGFIYDDSRKIDAAVRGLLAATDDDYLGLACMRRLVGRGYETDIDRYCNRRMPKADEADKKEYEKIQYKAGWTRLHTAVERGAADEVRRRIGEGADVNAAGKDGRAPLHLAAEAGDEEVVKALLDGKANLNPRDAAGRTPVELAARADHEEVVLLLAEHGCDLPDILAAANAGKTEVVENLLQKDPKRVAATNARGATALHLAARQGHAGTATALLKAGAAVDASDEYGWTPLHLAAVGGHQDAMILLLEHKANPNAVNDTENKCTPLHLAVLSGNLKTAETLLEHGASPNVGADCGNGSPLHLAVRNGLVEMTALLLVRGGKVELKNRQGESPLRLAVAAGRAAVVRVLLAHKANVNARDEYGFTLLYLAAGENHAEVASLLLDAGAAVDATSNDGETPLLEAAGHPDAAVGRILLEHKANPRIAAKNGSQPLHVAARENNPKAVELLLDHGAAVNAKDGDGQTPLHLAAARGHVETVQTLLARGAAVNVGDDDGWTPLHWAVRTGSVEVVKALLDHKADPTVRNSSDQAPLDIPPARAESEAEIDRLLKHALPRN